MSNYTLNNIRRIITHIDETDYWDFHLCECRTCDGSGDSCTAALIDTSLPECLEADGIVSTSGTSYHGACVSNGLRLENIGYTGVDNGLISYDKDRITNEQFYKLYTDSVYEVGSGDTRLHLHKVSGNTKLYDYPVGMNADGSIKLNGGFYQGFFRSGDGYSVLPSRVNGEWNLHFEIRREDYEPESDKTLNDKHPDNKGIFFYIGTRAENKWVYMYEGIPMSGTSFGDCELEDDDDYVFDLVEDEIVLSAQTYDTKDGFGISSANDGYIMSDNKFLIFDRTPDGITVKDYEEGDKAMISFKTRKFGGNLFLYMDRTCTGHTVSDIDSIESGSSKYDMDSFYGDIYGNALAFMVNGDGSVGYRYLVKDCNSPSEGRYSVLEGSSLPGMVKASQWACIRVRMASYGDGMKMMFYVDGKLKYITAKLPMLDLRKLDELDSKQEGVAYSISLGGGTQGLAETVMPDFTYLPTRVFPIEENFAGSFIGDIRKFRFDVC